MTNSVVHTAASYRRDIDGLRAVAVLAVVLFHARVPWIAGGFVGVDVFFVISGFLITTLLLGDIGAGRFSIADFYERRIRRILPALVVLLAFSALGAHLLLLPEQMRDFGGTLLATVLFSSNVVFWRQSGYFDGPAETKPFLHTWSLAVEEQFYILFPVFLYLVSRYLRGRYAFAILAAFVLSLALSSWSVSTSPVATFYLAPTRAWELLLGALLATRLVPEARHAMGTNVLALVGLGCIGYAVFAFSSATRFPGANALYPAVGAALIIYSGTASTPLVSRLLSTRPLVFVGLISYSLYLWHWVLLVFARYYLVRPITGAEIALVMAVSALAAVASWRFIERPFRGRRGVGSRRWLFAGAAASSLALGGYGVAALVTNGMPGRFGREEQVLIADSEATWNRRADCAGRVCTIGVPSTRPTFALWGDSHAGAIAPALEQVALRTHRSGLVAHGNGCAPILNLRRYVRSRENCAALNDSVLSRLEALGIRTVFLHARWGLYVEGSRYGSDAAPPELLTASRRIADNYPEFGRLLRITLTELRQRHLNVVIIASIPEVAMDVPTVLIRTAMSGASPELGPRLAEFSARQFRTFGVLRTIADEYAVPIVYPHEVLCDDVRCAISRDGHALYRDGHHLSVSGALFLAPLFERLLSASPSDGS